MRQDGKVIGVVVAARDVPEEHELPAALSRPEEGYRQRAREAVRWATRTAAVNAPEPGDMLRTVDECPGRKRGDRRARASRPETADDLAIVALRATEDVIH